jgi:hypothetical protein
MADSCSEISKLISQYKANPLLPLELPIIVEYLKNDNASVLDLKEQYCRDPLFCTYLIDLAWQKTKNKPNHPFATNNKNLSHVIMDSIRTTSENFTDCGKWRIGAEC